MVAAVPLAGGAQPLEVEAAAHRHAPAGAEDLVELEVVVVPEGGTRVVEGGVGGDGGELGLPVLADHGSRGLEADRGRTR